MTTKQRGRGYQLISAVRVLYILINTDTSFIVNNKLTVAEHNIPHRQPTDNNKIIRQ